jgi:parallel beta-helix repeat protein
LFLAGLASNVQWVKADTGTVYIRADGSIDPPSAPMQRNGNVYTLTGNITSDVDDGIVVERDSILVDGSGFAVGGTGANYMHGIYLHGRSNVTIQNTNIKNFYYGILLYSSSNNSISGNKITSNSYGIGLDSSSNNSISGNKITSNSCGIGLGYSSNYNSINENNITNNGDGIWLGYSSNNTVCHNNLINNTVQVNDDTPDYANSWDNGREGNHWSDYNGTDANHDGIGDTLYIIDENNTDHYPLMSIIPEFPSLLIPALFMTATLLAVMFYIRKHSLKQHP